MRRVVTVLCTVLMLVGVMALPAFAPVEKYTFNDVVLPDGQTGEITAAVKILKNKDDSVECSYFTDDFQESLGYYFEHVDEVPLAADPVLQFCLDNFDNRHA